MGTDKPEKCSVDFLIEEYKHLAESFWKNEESGEKRVNFFISFVTAVIAALVALKTSDKGDLSKEAITLIAFFGLMGLQLIGIFTLLRIIRRNRVTDEYKKAMNKIRDLFRNYDADFLKDYQPFDIKRGKRTLGRGGLVEAVALINSLIFAAIFAMLAFSFSVYIIGLIGLFGFIIALSIQLLFILCSQNK